jgi:hypothetical protein
MSKKFGFSNGVRVFVLGTKPERTKLWCALIAAIALQLFVLYYQLNYGALVGLIEWDDCAILLRGLENIDKLVTSHSLRQVLGAALHLNIHEAVSDIQTIVGLLLTGGAIWGPYALNVSCLCIAIYALSTTTALKNSIVFATSVLFLLVQPITFIALSRQLSDWQGAILMSGAMFVLFDAAEESNNYSRAVGAALLGLMSITKLTAFYLPVLALGVFLVFEFYGALKHRLAAKEASNLSWTTFKEAFIRLGAISRHLTLCVALILMPYLFFFLYKYKELLGYIRLALGPMWADDLTVSERLLFYSPLHMWAGVRGEVWGSLHFMFLIFLAAGLIAALLKRAWLHVLACLGILPIAAVFLVPLVLAHTSYIGFGATFLGAIMGGTLICLWIFAANTPRWGALASPVVVLALALPTVLPLNPPRDQSGTLVGRSELEHYQAIYDDMVGMIARRETSARPEVVFTFGHMLLPEPNLAIRYFQHTRRFLSIHRIDDFSEDNAASFLANADFVVTITPTGELRALPDLPANLPTSANPALGDARVRETGRYGLIASYQVQGGEIQLYQAGVSAARTSILTHSAAPPDGRARNLRSADARISAA